jgi:hypothetical protein
MQEQVYSFGVSGELWANGLIMYDHQTDSLWSHVAGQAITGRMQGTTLRMLPALRTDWGTWKKLRPYTLVLDPSNSPHQRDYGFDPYESYYASHETGVIATRREDRRIDPKAFVLSLRVDGEIKAYPFAQLHQEPVVNDRLANTPVVVVFQGWNATGLAFDRRIGEQELTFVPVTKDAGKPLIIRDEQTGSVWSGVDGIALEGRLQGQRLEPIPATYAFWFAWKDHYPDTAVHGEASSAQPKGSRN